MTRLDRAIKASKYHGSRCPRCGGDTFNNYNVGETLRMCECYWCEYTVALRLVTDADGNDHIEAEEG